MVRLSDFGLNSTLRHLKKHVNASLPSADGKMELFEPFSSEIMHIAPELLTTRAKDIHLAFESSPEGDIYALGCVANQIMHRHPLAERIFIESETMNEEREWL